MTLRLRLAKVLRFMAPMCLTILLQHRGQQAMFATSQTIVSTETDFKQAFSVPLVGLLVGLPLWMLLD
jgi:hypothetical protein